LAWTKAFSEEYRQIAGLLDVKTTFSDGKMSVEELVRLARKREFEVVIINDHVRVAMEYGLFPFRHILKKRIERASILKNGVEKYLKTIEEVSKKYPDMVIIPGAEASPFYYWTGYPFSKNFTSHHWEKHISIIGLHKAEDYKNLPILHNGLSTAYFWQFLPHTLIFFIPLSLGLLFIRWGRYYRVAGIITTILSILSLINYHPFRSSPFDPYHGEQGILPYQVLIDYVRERGGMTFWTHPETRSGVRRIGSIQVSTPPHPDDLIKAKNYTGFAALYGDTITVTEPGKHWDIVLNQYCNGSRENPVWGISTADYHREGGAGVKLGDFPTIFLVKEKTEEEVLKSLQEGRMYCYRGDYRNRAILNSFLVSDPLSGKRGTMGDTIKIGGFPHIHIKISTTDGQSHQIKIRLIRSGSLIATFIGETPFEVNYEDHYFKPGEKVYYRIDMSGYGRLVSNPIFVRFAPLKLAARMG